MLLYTVDDIAHIITANYILLPLIDEKPPTWDDKVHWYACETLTLGWVMETGHFGIGDSPDHVFQPSIQMHIASWQSSGVGTPGP